MILTEVIGNKIFITYGNKIFYKEATNQTWHKRDRVVPPKLNHNQHNVGLTYPKYS